MALRKFFDPFEELRELTSEVEHIIESTFGPAFHRRRALPGVRREEGLVRFAPAVELTEDNGDYLAKVEVPGVSPEDIEVIITPEQLTVKGEVKGKKEEERKGYHYSEFTYGSFRRILPFPNKIDDSQAKASFKNGILEVRVPRAKEAVLEGRKLAIE
ncbi:MAG: Spore protein SP21 [candidate division WS2 bacterium]|nr:Spore protein SP21 [Candidatus Psychracetigena formicireducens]